MIAHAYAQWGADCLTRLNGDFAFAVWDRATNELFLARDRFGVRPLFLAELDGDLVFASEAKAILRHPAARRELDPAGLVESLMTWANLPERSAFAGIRELAPAHYLRVGPDGAAEERRWWDLDFTPRDDGASDDELIAEVEELLSDATRLRLRADVPVGAYLSGGLDSSATAALARRHLTKTLYSFGIGFEDELYDESEFQDRMAAELGTDLTRVTVDARDIAELMPRAVELSEKPTLRTAPAPLLRLSRAVQDAGLKVVLTGEGADELFAGYDIFREDKVRRFWARDPESRLRPLLLGRLNAFLARDLSRSGAFLTSFYGRGLTELDDPLYSHRLRFANTARHAPPAAARSCSRRRPPRTTRSRAWSPGSPRASTASARSARRSTSRSQTFLEGYLLHSQGDRMLMGHSIEGRFPFLDYRVAELAAAAAGPPASPRPRGEVRAAQGRRALPPRGGAHAHRSARTARRSARSSPGPTRRSTSVTCCGPSGSRRPASSRPRRSRASSPSSRRPGSARAGETDEMALVGALSTMLLHEQLVARPSLAPEAVPTRVVVGARVERGGVPPPAPVAEAVG